MKLFNMIKTLHERIKQVDVYNIDDLIFKNDPYTLCFSWLLEIVGFGLLTTIPINIFLGWQGWFNFGWIVVLGLIRWLFLNFIYKTFEAARGKT